MPQALDARLLHTPTSACSAAAQRYARITLDAPGADDLLCGVATLTPLDAAASKLLANSDRWRDDAVLSRDLIDLAMMAPPKALLREAIVKAQGATVEADQGTRTVMTHRYAACNRNSTFTASYGNSTLPVSVRFSRPAASSAVMSP